MGGVSLYSAVFQFISLGLAMLILRHRKLIFAVLYKFPRDIKGLSRLVQVQLTLLYYQRNNMTVASVFDKIVQRKPNKVVLYFENEEWTAERVQKLSNQIANYFQQQGFKKGDSVALFMENRPEYLSIWLGLSKIGVKAALVNYNLRRQPLKHCIEAVSCKAIIFNQRMLPALEELNEIGGLSNVNLYSWGNSSSAKCVDLEVELKSASEETPVSKEPIGFLDPLFYIYTSGTTGLPKGAIIKHARFMMAATGNYYMHGLRYDDILYTSLPLYHGSGTMLGSGQVLMYGVSMVIREKFSASRFWEDCIRYNVTAAQYIGEICRYLISQPESPNDKRHKVRVFYGNGLRAEIWENFVKRFNISHVSELYGSTEGNCNMVNIDDKIGAVGFIPRYAKFIVPLDLARVDEETGEPIRNPKTGFVVKCDINEPGELIGRIDRNHPIRDFEGYADQNSSKSKILTNVFKKGDTWFRSGDILSMDIYGYFYFKDRKGDTFRWKGENCSTAEVESVISTVCGLKDAVVYGVEIPGSEGRAGMAAIADPDDILDLESLFAGFAKSLPPYAKPVFIRKLAQIDMTGTFKMKKYDLQKDGFDITKVKDKIYMLSGSKYVLVDETLYQNLKSGKMRL